MPVIQEILEQIQQAVVRPLALLVTFFLHELLVYEANDAAGEPILQWADDMQQAVEIGGVVVSFKTKFVFRVLIELNISLIQNIRT